MSMAALYVGVSGLQTASNSLNTTANNLSNVNTAGYVRQQVINKDKAYNLVGTTSNVTTGQKGMGVTIGTINHVRDIFLDESYRKETGRKNFYENLYNSIYEIETQMGETDFISGIGFQKKFSDLLAAMNEVAKEPTGQTARSALVQSAVNFIDSAQNIYNGLAKYQSTLNIEVNSMVDRINQIGERMVQINRSVAQIESGAEQAMNLRDERDLLLDELSQYVKLSVSEDELGVQTVCIEGVQFCDEMSYSKIGLRMIAGSDLTMPTWTNLNNQDIYNLNNTISTEKNTDVGGLKGLLVARGSVTAIGYTMQTPLRSDFAAGPDGDADYEAAVNAHEEYLTSSDISPLVNVMANFDKLISTIVSEINNILCPETTTTAAFTAGGVTYPAGTVILDSANAPVSANKKLGVELITRTYCDRYTEVTADDGKVYYVRNDTNVFGNLSQYSINNISVNTSILQDYSLIPLTEQDGSASYDRAQALVELFSQDLLHYNGGADGLTFGEYFEAMINDVAITGSIYKSMSENETTLAAQLDGQRQEILGVSSDDELTNMIRYQQAYNAASRYINVQSEMMESLIMNLGAR